MDKLFPDSLVSNVFSYSLERPEASFLAYHVADHAGLIREDDFTLLSLHY